MATHTIVTTARQDAFLERLRLQRNAERARQELAPHPTVEAMIRAEFGERLTQDVQRLAPIDRERVSAAYGQAAESVQQQIRTLLGVQ